MTSGDPTSFDPDATIRPCDIERVPVTASRLDVASRYRVYCVTCDEMLHESTTSPDWFVAAHRSRLETR